MKGRHRWWEVETDGEFLRVRGILGNAHEIREIVKALQANLAVFERREARCVQCGSGPYDTLALSADFICIECRDRIVESVAKAIAHSFAVGSPDIADGLRMDWQTWKPEALAALAAAEAAQGIEAAPAAETTEIGSVHESPVAESDAPKAPPLSRRGDPHRD